MIRLAVLADIHGNLPALEAVIADMAGEALDQVIVAGDLINVGPFSAQVLQTVCERGWPAIRGNHEFYLLEEGTAHQPAERRGWRSLGLLREQLGEDWLQRIAAMPDELTLRYPDAPPLRVLHGAPGNPFRSLDRLSDAAAARELLAGVAERNVVCGHYHLPFERSLAGWQVINPGSVGAPMAGLREACYAILEGDAAGWRVTQRHVAADYGPLFAEFERQEFVARCGVRGFLIVEQFRHARPLVQPFRRWQRERYPDCPWSLAQAREFLFSGELWRHLKPNYRYNRHLLAPPPIDRQAGAG